MDLSMPMMAYRFFIIVRHVFTLTTMDTLEFLNTLLLGEVVSPRMAMHKWIGNEEGSLIPRGRIQGATRVDSNRQLVALDSTCYGTT